jgi:hypothetical protein
MADYSSVESYLRSKILERRDEIAGYMVRGQVKDHAEYRQLSGQIQGLEFTEQLLTDLAKRLTEDADE